MYYFSCHKWSTGTLSPRATSVMESGSGGIIFASALDVVFLPGDLWSIKGIYLPRLQPTYIMERSRGTPINTTIQKREECEVLRNHCFSVILKSFYVAVIKASSTQDMCKTQLGSGSLEGLLFQPDSWPFWKYNALKHMISFLSIWYHLAFAHSHTHSFS